MIKTFCRLLILTLAVTPLAWAPATAQQGGAAKPEAPRASTGGAQTLEDILARQRGEKLDDDFRRQAVGDPAKAAGIAAQLGTLGGASDSEVFRALRYGSADVTVSARGPAMDIIIQDSGMWWLELRKGPLLIWGGWLLVAMIVVVLVYLSIRGPIRIEGEKTGRTILRFSAIERFSHWLLAGSFILLGLSGLITLFGRFALIPVFGKDFFSVIALASKWIHNNVAWAFIVALVMVFVCWVVHNVPNRADLIWLAKGGGLFSKHVHPPARKFNAGQKIVFWIVIVLGISISASGLSLLFPFEMPMFAKTFEILNALGLPQLFGMGELQTEMTPHEEMQYAQLWHTVVAFVFIAIIIAHIYLGSVGMEGAFESMESGEVDRQWAKEHHSLWYEEVVAEEQEAASREAPAAPAE
ncbi:MAG: formate dehydrogenase subunit gamma [Defluviicoccus sp.]|nr:formate dehydrogenase subunit gamma [Defluviicoccus sp.]MDE0384513.1 formate dehydrogenase subunit gamma [Defluviicoccus sp.]